MPVKQIQQVQLDLKEETAKRLFAIPSATTPVERQLAMHYVATQWDGTGDVFENGPLLGGATRALGMGMLYNDRREPDSLLQTYDWFSSREPLDVPIEESLFEGLGKDGVEARRAFYEDGTFLPLFEALHRHEDYWKLVRPHGGYLPGHRDEPLPKSASLFEAPDREFAVCYIDGCKSWYGTKYWFREIAPRLLPNADFLFQDFAHYTCFWIPMLVGTFRERFELRAYVDYTYVWRLKDPPTEDEIEATFPDEPIGLDRDVYDEVLGIFQRDAEIRGDRYGFLLAQMQRAAAYAYLGLFDESRSILDGLLMKAEWMQLRPYLQQARVSPTYTPEGRIEL